MKMCNNIEMTADLSKNKIPRQFNDIKYEYKKYEDVLDKDKKSGISHMILDIGQDAITKQTIKDDIHKMDVCWDEDQNIIINNSFLFCLFNRFFLISFYINICVLLF